MHRIPLLAVVLAACAVDAAGEGPRAEDGLAESAPEGVVADAARQVSFTIRSTTMWSSRVKGIGLTDDGSMASFGLGPNTCLVRTSDGRNPNDTELTDDRGDETTTDGDEDSVVVTSSETVVEADLETGEREVYEVDGALDARRVDGGVVVLRVHADRCEVWWFVDGEKQVVDLDQQACEGDMDVRRTDGTVFLAYGEVLELRPDSDRVLAYGDLVRWNEASAGLFVADQGGVVVTAYEADGTERWQRETEHGIGGLVDMGAIGAVGVEIGEGRDRQLLVYEGYYGGLMGSWPLSLPGMYAIRASGDGRVLALASADMVTFLDVAVESAWDPMLGKH